MESPTTQNPMRSPRRARGRSAAAKVVPGCGLLRATHLCSSVASMRSATSSTWTRLNASSSSLADEASTGIQASPTQRREERRGTRGNGLTSCMSQSFHQSLTLESPCRTNGRGRRTGTAGPRPCQSATGPAGRGGPSRTRGTPPARRTVEVNRVEQGAVDVEEDSRHQPPGGWHDGPRVHSTPGPRSSWGAALQCGHECDGCGRLRATTLPPRGRAVRSAPMRKTT